MNRSELLSHSETYDVHCKRGNEDYTIETIYGVCVDFISDRIVVFDVFGLHVPVTSWISLASRLYFPLQVFLL